MRGLARGIATYAGLSVRRAPADSNELQEHRALLDVITATGPYDARGGEGHLQRLPHQCLRRTNNLVGQPCHLDLRSLPLVLLRPDLLRAMLGAPLHPIHLRVLRDTTISPCQTASTEGRRAVSLRHMVGQVYAERCALHRGCRGHYPDQGHRATAQERALPGRVFPPGGRGSLRATWTRGGLSVLRTTEPAGGHPLGASWATESRDHCFSRRPGRD